MNVILKAQIEVEKQIDFILKKATFFDTFKDILNERQLKVIKRMLEAGMKGFEGGMSAKKYIQITATSKATATRDLQQLVETKVFKPLGGGRSARYELIL
jgi:Fic family protein